MHPGLLLVVYALICIAASLAGGWVPLIVRLTHRRMQMAISFVSGIVLGIGLMHLLPHSFFALGSIDQTVLWVLAGYLFMFFLERFFHFHHHDAPEDGIDASATAGHHAAGEPHAHDGLHGAPSSWIGVAIGLTLHALVDGLALGAAVRAEQMGNHVVALAGLGTCLAVALHKPFDALTIGTLMAAAGKSPATRQAVNGLYSLVTPLGLVLFYTLSAGSGSPQAGLGQMLGFSAGAFLCIASCDLLPELQFHRHDRVKLSAALLAGLALAWATVFLETGGHDHSGLAEPLLDHNGHQHDGHEHEHH